MQIDAAYLPMLLPAWLLVAARVAGLVLAVPTFSALMVPDFFRVILIATISTMMLPVALPKLATDLTIGHAVAGAAGEVLVGVVLGLAASVVFLAAETAGHVVSQQAGLSLGEVFNPALDVESGALQQIWSFLAMVVFVSVGGLKALVQVLLGSFDRIPPLMFMSGDADARGAALTDFSVGMMDLSFRLAIRLAAPAMLALALSTLTVGFIARTIPQFNVLTVGFSLKIVLAVLFVALAMSRSGGVMTDALWDAFDGVGALFEQIAGGIPRGR